ncbi:exonuclease domain-containing protein [Micromonospora sp. NBC_01796]|uniref:exonuclease domain-containing protein n=1 Tax=Micromonospora sp. NBC_01796 TaxID=2975987 RepID=UPI002DD93CFF|nr:exonuclease domain-containing protein [Micromonospora sp. NBC_01796]WSA87401.1 exonuclease domain-containing protein [Micromonospora sp. NBC_01796]
MYAVIDVETTGFNPGMHDRVCEIAVVHVDGRGQITDQWSSLVNPERDLGPQHIHGIRAADARRAPKFHQLAGEVARRLRHRLPVAHNLAFDARFVTAEYGRLGATVPLHHADGLCTMRLAANFLPLAGRSLADCCLAAAIPQRQAHSALDDALAAAHLLAYYLRAVGQPPPWEDSVRLAGKQVWPELAQPVGVAAMTRSATGGKQEHFLARLIDRLPRVPDPPQADAYLALLDQALLDRYLSATEMDALVDTAGALKLTRREVVVLHRQYLRSLAAEAADDGVVTAEELRDLHAVATLLDLPPNEVEGAIGEALSGGSGIPAGPATTQRFSLTAGDIVVFTGQMDEPREVWEARAIGAGYDVGRSVTKKTTLLVAADPDSLSGKARLAHKYGIPVVRPAAFLTMLHGR